MTLLSVFASIKQSALGSAIRSSQWPLPAIEAVHLLGLALLGGRGTCGRSQPPWVGLRHAPLMRKARGAEPWLIGGIAVMLPTGLLLFASEAIKCYEHEAFWVKMTGACFRPLLHIYDSPHDDHDRGSYRTASKTSRGTELLGLMARRWIGFS
jgi:hypothetical protein